MCLQGKQKGRQQPAGQQIWLRDQQQVQAIVLNSYKTTQTLSQMQEIEDFR
jgi:hypothetical protein